MKYIHSINTLAAKPSHQESLLLQPRGSASAQGPVLSAVNRREQGTPGRDQVKELTMDEETKLGPCKYARV